jgi:hypothetical protein
MVRQLAYFCVGICTFVPVKEHLYLEIRSYGSIRHRAPPYGWRKRCAA